MADSPPPPPPPPPSQPGWPQPSQPPPSQPGWQQPSQPPAAPPGYRGYGYQPGRGALASGIQWPFLISAFIPLVLSLLPITGLGIISSSIGLVIFGTRLGNPYLRKTAVVGIAICLVALIIAIVKTTLVNQSINY